MECTVSIGDVYKSKTGEELLLLDIQKDKGQYTYFLFSLTYKKIYSYHNDYTISRMELINHRDEVPKFEDFRTYYEQCDNCGLIKRFTDLDGDKPKVNEMIYDKDNKAIFCCNSCREEWLQQKNSGGLSNQKQNLKRMYEEQELKDKEYLHVVKQLNKLK